jgi:hypothetical protein
MFYSMGVNIMYTETEKLTSICGRGGQDAKQIELDELKNQL